MNRRKFLFGSACLVGGSAMFRRGLSRNSQSNLATNALAAKVPGVLTITVDPDSHLVPLNFLGLSYELAQLRDPRFFSPTNLELVALFRLLSPCGVLRLGGNSGESCWLKVNTATTPPELPHVAGPVSENWMPRELFMIPLEAILNLAGFLWATGWQLVYGMNLGHSSPDRLAREAEVVANLVREQLLYFQIGNEPDFYSASNNRTRPRDWGFNDYLREWTASAEAIVRRVPNARFGGPDVGASSSWIAQFIPAASKALGGRLIAVTGHYYAEGPPDDPKVTTERLLQTDPKVRLSAKAISDLAAKDRLVYRMTEGNSCYRGGKPGMSDTLASALWGGDYILSLAAAGCGGVNLHGGSRETLRAALGNKLPGELVAPSGNDTKGAYYTPIAGEIGQGFEARPLYYGMLLAGQFVETKIRAVTTICDGIDITGYAGQSRQGAWRIALFNKDSSRTIDLSIRVPSLCRQCEVWRLTGPSLNSTAGVSLAGAEVGPDCTWSPRVTERYSLKDGYLSLELRCASAAVLFIGP